MNGGGSWGFRRHRQGAHGKGAYPTSRWHKWRVAHDANLARSERIRIRDGHRALQEWTDAEDWLHR